MQDIVYVAADGLHVTLTLRTWTAHVQQEHPEVRLSDIERALMNR
jgi:hypothetical protein